MDVLKFFLNFRVVRYALMPLNHWFGNLVEFDFGVMNFVFSC